MSSVDGYLKRTRVAYFTMEIALRPEMHTYSGGLGGLAGDTARSCADLELPVVFVSLVTRAGYMRQEIDSQGWQTETSDPWEPAQWCRPLGAKIALTMEGREVWVRPWLYLIRGVTGYEAPVILLDTDLDENTPEDRKITDCLYGGDRAYRLKQEVVLGIGGVRVLRALGFDIGKYHLNEGHSALLVTELLRKSSGSDMARVRDACIFTTHTPVEAGHDQFSYDTVEQVLNGSIDIELLRRFGGQDRLNMTMLALNLSGYVNGVAKRHAETSRRMFPGHQVHAVTNGVHAPTWVSPAFAHLFDRHFTDWRHDPEVLIRAGMLSDNDVWAAHSETKQALVNVVKERTGVALDPEAPVIGFARRMTAYKRANLLFSDPDRLRAIAGKRPFQVVLSGKAHPHDQDGKRIIALLHQRLRELKGQMKVAFVPNYDMEMARHLIAGSDVWLNTPVPPLEASGTSGMKASMNGVLNLSTLDGWWVEACAEGETGWAIGDGSTDTTIERDAALLYDKLEETVLDLYYRDRPRWIWMMKQCISRVGSQFTTHRMMRRYGAEAYLR